MAFTTLCVGGWPSQAREVLAGELGSAPPPFPELWGTRKAAAAARLDAVEVRRHELRFPLEPGQSLAEQVTARMGALAALREQLERRDRWPRARDRLDGHLTGCVRTAANGSMLVDQYLLVIGWRR